jgi:hypothetical protein
MTVQAPHSARSQPSFVPVRPSLSRRVSSRVPARLDVHDVGGAVHAQPDRREPELGIDVRGRRRGLRFRRAEADDSAARNDGGASRALQKPAPRDAESAFRGVLVVCHPTSPFGNRARAFQCREVIRGSKGRQTAAVTRLLLGLTRRR